MSAVNLERLADFLEQRAQAVRTLEAQGREALAGPGGQAGFEARMREKAALLAALEEDAAAYLEDLPEGLAGELSGRLAGFSRSAATSLRIGSVFYMSALLYPEDYAEGSRNDLENLIAGLRR